MQAKRPVVGLKQQPVAVELALERVLRCGQPVHRTECGQHRGEVGKARGGLLLHPVRQPLVAVGLDQRVAPGDLLAVQVDDHLAALVTRVAELLGLIGARVPDDDLSAAVLPPRDGALEGGVLQRVILGVHGQMIDRRGVGQVLGHRPRDQHAVAFQPEVVVQATGVVFLDDETVVAADRSRRFRHRLGCPARVTHAAVSGQPVFMRSLPVQAGQQVTVFGNPGQHLVVLQVPQPGITDLVPGPGRGDRRTLPSAQRVRRDRGLGPVVLTPVQEDLARAQALGHRRGHQFGHGLL